MLLKLFIQQLFQDRYRGSVETLNYVHSFLGRRIADSLETLVEKVSAAQVGLDTRERYVSSAAQVI